MPSVSIDAVARSADNDREGHGLLLAASYSDCTCTGAPRFPTVPGAITR